MYGKIVVEIPKTCRECRFFAQSYGYLCLGEEICPDEHINWIRNNYAAKRPEWCPISATSIKQDVLDIILDEIDSARCEFPFTHDEEVKIDKLNDLFNLIDSMFRE